MIVVFNENLMHLLNIVNALKLYTCKYDRPGGPLRVGNELVPAGSHARLQVVDKGIPSQGGSTE